MNISPRPPQQNLVTEGKVIVVSGLTVAGAGLRVIDMSEKNAVVKLGLENMKLTHPAYVVQTTYAEQLHRESVVFLLGADDGTMSNMSTRAVNEDRRRDHESYDRSVMIPTRASGIGQNFFPQAKAGPMELPAPKE